MGTETENDDAVDTTKPGLSPEEQAALDAPDDDEGQDAELAGAEGGGDSEKPTASGLPPEGADSQTSTDGAGQQPDAADDAVAAAEAGESADAAGDDDADAAAAADEAVDKGRYIAPNLATTRAIEGDIGEKIAGVDTQLDALDAQYEAGDIEFSAYSAQSRALNNERSELVSDKREAEFTQKNNAAMAEHDWDKSVADFQDANEQFKQPIMLGALNAALNELYADPENAGASHQFYLETAKRSVLDVISPAEAAAHVKAESEGADVSSAASAAVKASRSARDKLPKTLGDVPAAGQPEEAASQFDSVDNLDGMDIEAAIARMTPEQQEKYAQSQ